MKQEQMPRVLSEVSHYLKGCDERLLNKLPEKLRNFIEDNKDKEYNCTFDYRKKLSELNLMPETKSFITLIYISYWCDEESKQKLIKELKQNDIDYEKELSEKYSVIFPNANNNYNSNNDNNNKQDEAIEKEETKEVVTYNETKWYQVIFSKIKKVLFFWKKN